MLLFLLSVIIVGLSKMVPCPALLELLSQIVGYLVKEIVRLS